MTTETMSVFSCAGNKLEILRSAAPIKIRLDHADKQTTISPSKSLSRNVENVEQTCSQLFKHVLLRGYAVYQRKTKQEHVRLAAIRTYQHHHESLVV